MTLRGVNPRLGNRCIFALPLELSSLQPFLRVLFKPSAGHFANLQDPVSQLIWCSYNLKASSLTRQISHHPAKCSTLTLTSASYNKQHSKPHQRSPSSRQMFMCFSLYTMARVPCHFSSLSGLHGIAFPLKKAAFLLAWPLLLRLLLRQ